MVIKKKMFSTRAKLMILLIILIILIGYAVVTNLPPAMDFVNPHQVTSNYESYVDKSFTIKGYLDKNNENLSVITNTMDSTKTRDMIRVEYSNVSNLDDLVEGSIYFFTGVLKKIKEIDGDSLPVPIYVFNAEKFEEV
jgi:hypothetical protein